MNSYFLPEFEVAESVGLIPGSLGQWQKQLPEVVEKLGKAITVSKGQGTRGISAIPSPWARPLLFGMILNDKSHPMHESIFGEWIGLLGVIAFSQIDTRLTVEIKKCVLNAGSPFESALKTLAPPKVGVNGQEFKWEEMQLIYLSRPEGRGGAVCVGALSPHTIVFTGINYQKGLKGLVGNDSFSFINNQGAFCKPDENSHREDLEALYAWILRTMGDDKRWLLGEMSPVNQVYELVKAFKYGTKVELAAEPVIPNHLFSDFLTPLRKEAETKSDWWLDNECGKKVVVVCKDMYKQSLREKRLAGTKTAVILGATDDKSFEQKFAQATGSELGGIQVCWIRPDLLFFTDEIYSSSNLISGASHFGQISEKKYLPPLKPEILQYFRLYQPESWRTLNPSYKTELDGSVTFSVTLRIKDTVDQGGVTFPVTISKRYAKESIRKLEKSIVAVFPEYPSAEWPNYSIFSILPPGFGIDALADDASGTADRLAIPYDNASKEHESPTVLKTATYPAAIAIKDNNGKHIGIVPFFRPSLTPHNYANQVVYGVDFGTSNTNIFKKVGDSKGQKLTLNFERFCRTILCSIDDKAADDLLRKVFVPRRNITLPVPTALRKWGGSSELVSGCFPYFHEGEIGLPSNVHVNLKWDGSGDSRDRSLLYFKGLAYLIKLDCLNHGNSSPKFCFSYPRCFTSEQKQAFKTNWGNAIDLQQDVSLYTEGYASGYFFSKAMDLGGTETGMVGIDVGGGTTDISLWLKGRILKDCSIKLAGSQVAELLKANVRILDLLFAEEKFIGILAMLKLYAANTNPFLFHNMLAFFLSSKIDEKKLTPQLFNQVDKSEFQWMLMMFAIQFGAVAYYSGLMVSEYKEQFKEQMRLVWGGNGAKFLRWLNNGRELMKDDMATSFMDQMFHAPLEDRMLPDRNINSPNPKDEVAGGLVEITDSRNAETGWSTLDSVEESWDVNTTADQTVRQVSLFLGAVLKNKQSLFNDEFNGLLQLTETGAHYHELRQRIAEFISSQRDEKSREPLFLVGVRELLTILSKQGPANP